MRRQYDDSKQIAASELNVDDIKLKLSKMILKNPVAPPTYTDDSYYTVILLTALRGAFGA